LFIGIDNLEPYETDDYTIVQQLALANAACHQYSLLLVLGNGFGVVIFLHFVQKKILSLN